jgi:hypothetical protein
MKSILYWEIPSSVDVEGFLKKYPPSFKYKIDHFYYIVDYISRGMDIENIDDNAGFVNTNAKRLQKVIHNYKMYLEHMLKHRFIRTDMNYIPGKKSKGYLLNKYSDILSAIKKIPINDFVIHKHKIRELNEQKEIIKATQKQHPHLTKWFDGLQINREKALKEVKVIFPIKTTGIRGVAKRKASNWAKRYRAVQAINKIANGQFYYNIDDNVGRFHSNLTNLNKELRNFITYNGQHLVNVDIKNSQPLLSTLLLNTDFYNHNSLCNITTIPGYQYLLSNTYHSYPSLTIMVVKTLKKSDNQDINIYIEFVNSGSFYQKIFNLLYPDKTFEKDKVKTMIFMIFFSNNRYMGKTEAEPKRRFKEMFPRTYEVFKILKLCDHTALSRILQRIESNLMIQNVVPRISREKPDLPIFTIHDSVVTTVGNEEYVATVILEEIKKYTGLEAKIGFEYWR